MQIEIIYAGDNDVYRQQLDMPEASTVAHAIAHSGLQQRHPELDWTINKVGIFGKLVQEDTLLKEHDRIEIYRPLAGGKKRSR